MKRKQLFKALFKTRRNTEIILKVGKIYYPITSYSYQETSDGNTYLVLESNEDNK